MSVSIKKIRKIINSIHFYSKDVSYDDKDDITNYAPYIFAFDKVGTQLIKKYLKFRRIAIISIIAYTTLFLYYFLCLLIFPIFYMNFFENENIINIFHQYSFGLTTFLYQLKWHWEVIFHFVSFYIFFFILAGIIENIDLYRRKNKIEKYILQLYHKGLITREYAFSNNQDNAHDSNKLFNDEIKNDKNKSLKSNNSNVFIVHGHDDLMKTETARFVETLGLEAIILHEQSNTGRTIIEKIEKFSNVAFAIVLLSPDDKHFSSENPGLDIKRARQNVIFEHGYLMAKLGRKKVCALVKENVEIPSDLSGILFIPYDCHGAWKLSVGKEMKAACIEADYSKII